VVPRVGLEAVAFPGIEPRFLGHPARVGFPGENTREEEKEEKEIEGERGKKKREEREEVKR
jgi:hypothetical protein